MIPQTRNEICQALKSLGEVSTHPLAWARREDGSVTVVTATETVIFRETNGVPVTIVNKEIP
jgi:hypothetical protein